MIGAGSWGTALAINLAANGHAVRLWGRDADQMTAMRAARINERYLPGIELPPALEPSVELAPALEAARLILLSVPSHAFAPTLREVLDLVRARPSGPDSSSRPHDAGLLQGVAWATKGFDPQGPNGAGLLTETAAPLMARAGLPMAILSGPSFAKEVALALPTAITVAASTQAFGQTVAGAFHSGALRVYTTDDLIGVQVGGAVKNVLAIAAGVVDGLGFGANAQAALVTRGLAEITRLGVAMGGRPETFSGLAGVGDLMLTCTDNQSRNRRFGLALAGGQSVDAAAAGIGQVVEGVSACDAVLRLGARHQVELPICQQVQRVLTGAASPLDAVRALLARQPRAEGT